MALQLIKPGLYLPEMPRKRSGTSEADFTIDAAGEKSAFVFEVPKTGTIDRVGFFTRIVSNSQTIRVGLETLDANGDPSGTQYGGSAVGTQTSPAQLVFYEVTLATGASATKGDIVAAVFQFDGTVGNVAINAANGVDNSFPYIDNYTTVWAKTANVPYLSIRYNDGSYEPINTFPVNSQIAYSAFSSTSTPDERALRFLLPFPARIVGFWGDFSYGADFDVVLYEGTTALSTYSIVNIKKAGTGYGQYKFGSAILLSKDTVYRLAVKPTTTTNVGVLEMTVSIAAMMDMLSGGQAFYYSQRTDAGTWSDTTTRRPFMGLIIDQIDDGVGGSGGPVGNNFRGGFVN